MSARASVPLADDAPGGPSRRPIRAGRRLSLLLLLAFSTTALGLLALPSATLAWSANTFSSGSEQQLLALTNQARSSAGRRTLAWDSALASIARWRSKDMIDRDYFSHDIPGRGKVFDVMTSRGYCYRIAGENIGWNNYPDDVATAEIQQMFMASASHRQNILGHRLGPHRDRRLQGRQRQEDVDRPLRGPLRRDGVQAEAEAGVEAADDRHDPLDPPADPAPDRRPDRPTDPDPQPDPRADRRAGAPSHHGPGRWPRPRPDRGRRRGGSGGAADAGLRVVDPPAPGGLLETVVDGVAGFLFGG